MFSSRNHQRPGSNSGVIVVAALDVLLICFVANMQFIISEAVDTI